MSASLPLGWFAAILTLASSSSIAAEPTDLVNPVLWQQRSIEYQAVAEQTYRLATRALEANLLDCRLKRRPAPVCEPVAIEQTGVQQAALMRMRPAVILDLDETALDNSRFEGELQLTGDDFSKASWERWIEASGAPDADSRLARLTVPGAAAFTRRAAQLGVDVFYVSNRECAAEQTSQACPALRHTMALMQRQGFARANEPTAFLFASATGTDKTARRKRIADMPRRIALLVGDDLGDFVGSATRDAMRQGKEVPEAAHAQAQWGRGWFMLPNPMYGSWERYLTREAAQQCAPAAEQEADSTKRAACRQAKTNAKAALVQGFASVSPTIAADTGRPAAKLATWNLAWWMSSTTFAQWRTRCNAANPPSDLTFAPCDLAEQSAPDYHTSATTRDRRAQQFRAAIAAETPDVLMLQEVRDTEAANELLQGLGYSRVWTSFEAVPLAQSVGFAVRDGVDVAWPPHALTELSVPDQSQRGAGKPLRPGGLLQVNIGGRPVQILNVHLKASCRNDAIDATTNPDPGHCKTLRAQVPVLEAWIDARAQTGEDFILTGDFNRSVFRDFSRELPARLDGTRARDPLLPTTRVGSLMKEISDDQPSGASLYFPRVPAAGEVQSRCHKGIDHLALGKGLAQRVGLNVNAGLPDKLPYRYVETAMSPDGPSDHCMVTVNLSAP